MITRSIRDTWWLDTSIPLSYLSNQVGSSVIFTEDPACVAGSPGGHGGLRAWGNLDGNLR